MTQNDSREFSWPTLFIVTAVSFFAFAGFTKLIDGSSGHSGLFFKIGFLSFVFFAIAYAANNSAKPQVKKKIKSPRSRRNRVIEY